MNHKLALITGASSGIGKSTAMKLAQNGYSLILMGRRMEKLLEVESQILSENKKHPLKVISVSLELRDSQALSHWCNENKTLLNQVSVLINNAGLAKGLDKFHEGSLEQYKEMMDTNVMALMNLSREVIPYMVKKKQGHIVNIGSVAGRWVYPGGAVYCATKFAVRALSEGMRQDLLGTGLRVTNIEPGMVHTEFSEVRLGSKQANDKVYENMTPLTAQDIAESIFWALSQPEHVNIQELVIYPTDQAHIGMVHRRS